MSAFGLIYNDNRYDIFSISNLNLVSSIANEKFQIAIAFIYVAFIAGRLALNDNRKWEVIIGAFANFAALLCLFAEDFISIFIGIELLMIASTILIFMGGTPISVKAAKQYFLTHLFSSGLILIGISYLITTKGNTEIIPLTELINNKDQGFLFYTLLSIGCLINVAAVPFAGWLVNCYPKASGSGFIYLTAFSTKISIIILIKLFSGLAALKFIGIMMMIYGGVYACLEENLRKILCYLIISQLGLMVVATGISTKGSIYYVMTYIPIHIYYITLFIYLTILLENNNIKSCSQIKNIESLPFIISLFIAVLMITNFPFTGSFMTKLLLSQDSLGDFTYYLTLLLNIMIFIALPFRQYFTNQATINIPFNKYYKGLIPFVLFIVILNIIITKTYLTALELSDISKPIIKQLIIIAIGILAALIIKIPRISTKNFNLDLYWCVEKLSYFSINKYKKIMENKEEEEAYFNFKAMWNNILSKISAWHNQQTSIFIVILLLVGIIFILRYNVVT